MTGVILYQRDECQLCDRALEVMAAAGVGEFDSVWIDEHPGLTARYGTRVPVLARPAAGNDAGAELDWPFDAETVRAFLRITRA
ncbi:MAG TPA: NrdH-redoxin [Xanthomonadales bacterium]|nr:NrdH-redoxin [Xanthomonadales bacterium]